jgi:hypothetical protein
VRTPRVVHTRIVHTAAHSNPGAETWLDRTRIKDLADLLLRDRSAKHLGSPAETSRKPAVQPLDVSVGGRFAKCGIDLAFRKAA